MRRIVPLIGIVVTSCALIAPSAKFSPAELDVKELQNGYLVEILTENPASDVTTLITPANWLTITVTDTLLDTTMVAEYRSAMVDSTLVRRFETATQFSLRFVKPVSSAEVLREAEKRNILISVFFK
ncbi:MAG TPA: hypothetical protein VGA55_09380 [Bacteroidota bacterium]